MKGFFEWCTSAYAEEIHDHLKMKETTRIKLQFISPQAASRDHILGWMEDVAEKFNLSITGLHLAVYILDLFMDTHDINEDCFGPVAITCLMISMKYENRGNLPCVLDMIGMSAEHFGFDAKLHIVIRLERFILRGLNWRLDWPTAAHFCEYYRLFVVVGGDRDPDNTSHYSLAKRVQLTFDDLLNKSLQNIQLVNVFPSRTAAGVLLAARTTARIQPVWPESIQKKTSYHYLEVNEISNQLLGFDSADADSGYGSSPNVVRGARINITSRA